VNFQINLTGIQLEKFYKLKAKNIIIYSLEGLMQRKDKKEFFYIISKL